MTRLFEKVSLYGTQALQVGSIAQLVQSICLTSRGSGVRIPLLPHRMKTTSSRLFFVLCVLEMQSRGLKSSFCFLCLWSCASTRHCRNKQKPAVLLFISALSVNLAASVGIKNEVSKYLRQKRQKRQKRRKGWLGQRR